jgi:hypothetical protein
VGVGRGVDVGVLVNVETGVGERVGVVEGRGVGEDCRLFLRWGKEQATRRKPSTRRKGKGFFMGALYPNSRGDVKRLSFDKAAFAC